MSKKLSQFVAMGELRDGKIIPNNRRYFDGMLKGYYDCPIRIVVERQRGTVSQAQFGYLYGHLYEVMSVATGHTVQELDRIMKAKYLKDTVLWKGVNYVASKDKRDLLVDEASEFIDNVYNEALGLELAVEPPDKEWATKESFPELKK